MTVCVCVQNAVIPNSKLIYVFLGFAEVVQLLCQSENKPTTARQTRDEHAQRHARNAKLGKCLTFSL